MLKHKQYVLRRIKQNAIAQRKDLDNTTSLRNPQSKDFQSPDLKTDLLRDTGATSKRINIPT